jgi:hypothetical protein
VDGRRQSDNAGPDAAGGEGQPQPRVRRADLGSANEGRIG